MNADGSQQTRLTTNGVDEAYGWSPDSQKILFDIWQSSSGAFIYSMNVDGSQKVRLAHTDGFFSDAQWSPDGSRILFNTDNDLCIMNTDGGEQHCLLKDFFVSDASWSPDGKKNFIFGRSWRQ